MEEVFEGLYEVVRKRNSGMKKEVGNEWKERRRGSPPVYSVSRLLYIVVGVLEFKK